MPDASTAAFARAFGTAPTVTASAPGRVNLIGEHTDYNGGFVLPVAIPQRTTVALAGRPGGAVRAASREQGGKVETFALGAETPGRGWLDYVQGTTQALGARGTPVGAFDAWIASDVPLGSGLSSSAALLVALLRALREAFGLDLPDVDVATLAQHVENTFVGAHVGLMDQMASSLADEHAALFLDTRALTYRKVPLRADLAELLVVNSGVAHRLSAGDGGYNARRAQCEDAARRLGVPQLRDVPRAEIARLDALPDDLRRRARHVITENARVLDAVAALEAGDMPRLGALFRASHASMRDDYSVSTPEIDRLVALADAEPGVFGARLTGGGFGGSIVALCRPGTAAATGARVVRAYDGDFPGLHATVLVPPPAPAG